MWYNIRIFEFPNGEIQVRHYDAPMRYPEDRTDMEDEGTVVPFDGSVVKRELSDRDPSEEEKIETRKRSSNRTKQQMYMYARCVRWDYFITLTFNKDKIDRYDYSTCSKVMRQWLNNQHKRFAPDLKYLVVPEMHRDGAWHFHGLLADTGRMSFRDSGHKAGNQVIYNMDKWKFGFTTATKVEDTRRVSGYICKYITKNVRDSSPHRQRYFVSQNLPKPKVRSLLLMPDEKIEDLITMIETSTGTECVHASMGCGGDDNRYVSVDYYELQ